MFQGKYDGIHRLRCRLRANVHGAIEGYDARSYGAFEWMVYTTFGKWMSILAQSEPTDKVDFLQAMYRYARAAAFAGRKSQDAQAEQERMQAIAERIPEKEMLMA